MFGTDGWVLPLQFTRKRHLVVTISLSGVYRSAFPLLDRLEALRRWLNRHRTVSIVPEFA